MSAPSVAPRTAWAVSVLLAALLVAVLSGCAPQAGDVQRLDARNGFRDARFGTPVSGIPNLELVDSRNGFDCYQRPEENLTLGEATLTLIRYCFYGGRLATIVLSAQGVPATQELLRSLRASYGPGEPVAARTEGSPPMGEIWRGKRVTAMLLFVQRDIFAFSATGDVAVTLWSNDLVAQRDAQLGSGPEAR